MCYLPQKIDEMIDSLVNLQTSAQEFRDSAIEIVKKRFASVFDAENSLALVAALLCPGLHKLSYKYFPLSSKEKDTVRKRLHQEMATVVDCDVPSKVELLALCLKIALEAMDKEETVCEDVLSWWKKSENTSLNFVFPAVKMLLAIPVSSTDPERAFSSAGLILNRYRSCLSSVHFRQEFRLRQYLSVDPSRVERILDRYAATYKAVITL